MNDERDEPRLLNYQTPIRRDPPATWNRLRRLNRGEDTFLASSALLFALLCWATTAFGWAMGAPGLFACAGVVMLMVSVALALASFLERQTSRTFALMSLMLCGAYVVALVALRWRR